MRRSVPALVRPFFLVLALLLASLGAAFAAAPIAGYFGNVGNGPNGAYPGFDAQWDGFVNTIGVTPKFYITYVDISQSASTWATYNDYLGNTMAGDSRTKNAIPVVAWGLGTNPDGNLFGPIAAGTYDSQITGALAAWKGHGYSTVYLRIAHEMNGNWYPWAVSASNLSGYIAAFDHFASVAHNYATANGMTVKIVWNPAVAGNDNSPSLTVAQQYPGDPYVDVLGIDEYSSPVDPGWSGHPPNGTTTDPTQFLTSTMIAMGIAHNKPISFPEVGGLDQPFATDMVSELSTRTGATIAFFGFWDITDSTGVMSFTNAGDNQGTLAAIWKGGFGPNGTVPTSSVTTGGFHVVNGQMIDPNGKPFIAAGINFNQGQSSIVSTGSAGTPLTTRFPGINMVRVPVASYVSLASLEPMVSQLTALKIVVLLEHHPWPIPNALTGQALTDEANWYASVANTYKGNPYVWLATMNEPQNQGPGGTSDVVNQEVVLYNAIRGTGFNNPIGMELVGGGNPGTVGINGGMSATPYKSMTNVWWDQHFYAWMVNNKTGGYSTDIPTIQSVLRGSVASASGSLAAQSITSADGTVPVIHGEFGTSSDGITDDPDGTQLVTAVGQSGDGYMAWAWQPGQSDNLTDGNTNLTPFGAQTAGLIATTTNTTSTAVRVVAPLTGTVTKGTWITDQRLSVPAMPHGYIAYNVLLPQGYNPNGNTVYPLLFYGHENGEGTPGGVYPASGANLVNQSVMDGTFNTVAFRTAHPAIIVVPEADQSINTSGADPNSNFGGYADSPNSGGNEQGINALVAYMSANYKVDPTERYCTGDSLGAIGCLAWLVDNNTVNGANRYWAAGMSFSDQLYRPTIPNSNVFPGMKTVPFLAVSTPNDNNQASYDQPGWAYYTGNNNYPTPGSYSSGGVAALRAGTTNYYYMYTTSGVPWDTYRQMNADGGQGTALYAWLFSQNSGGAIVGTGGESIGLTAISRQTLNTPFAVAGSISGASSPPTLQYAVTGGPWQSLPTGSSVTATAFSFTVPGQGANGATTISVRDANNTAIVATSAPFAVSGPASANDTVVTTVGPAITDAAGNQWTITSGGQVGLNGSADTVTSNVVELAYVNGTIWQKNTAQDWYGKTSPTDTWSPAQGTKTSPLPVTAPPSTIKLMAMGDSVMAGGGTAVNGGPPPGGPRAPLYTQLTAAGYSVQMVGDQTSNPGGGLPSNQVNHEGIGGYGIITVQGDQVNPGMLDYLQAHNILATYTPDAIVLMIGANNLYVAPPANIGPTAAYTALQQLVTYIVQQLPNVKVIVSTETGNPGDAGNTSATELGQYNALIPGITGISPNVSFVNANANFVPSVDTGPDGLHPNVAGNVVIGTAFAAGVEAVFQAQTTPPETLSINAIGQQIAGTPFSVSGVISGLSAAPVLQYQDNNGVWQALPGGSSTTRSGLDIPGGNASPWNIPIGAGAIAGAASDPDTVAIGTIGIINPVSNYGQTLYIGRATDGLYTITGGYNGRTAGTDSSSPITATIHIPTGAVTPGPYPGDNALVVTDAPSMRQYGFQGVGIQPPGVQPGQGPFSSSLAEWDDVTSDLYGDDADSLLSGFNVGPGMITACDVTPSCNPVYPRIQHALRYSISAGQLKDNAIVFGQQALKPNSWPQRMQDGQSGINLYTGNLPAGTTLFIPSSTPMPTGLDANCQGAFWTMSHYPLFWRDQAGGGFHLTVDQVADTSAYVGSLRACINQLVPLLRPMRNQHQTGQSFVTNPANGPGARLDTGPPPLAGTVSGGGTVTATSFSFTHPGMATNGSNVVAIRDANAPTVTTTSNSFQVGSVTVEALAISPVPSVVAGATFIVSGTIANVTSVPTLQYQDGSGSWQALPTGAVVGTTSFTFPHPGLGATSSATISVRDASNQTVLATSNVFSVTAAPVETITVAALATQYAATSFTVAGTIANGPVGASLQPIPPTLQYQDNAGAWNAMPTGSSVTPTTFTFAHPGMTAAPSNTVTVRDASTTSVTGASPPFIVRLPESANNAVVTTAGPVLVDATGNTFAISAAGLILINNVADTATSSVVALAYVNHVLWQKNTSANWYNYLGTPGSYGPATKTSPLPAEVLAVNAIGTQTVGLSYNVTGTISAALTVPTLQYSAGGGVWQALPAGSAVTLSTFSFVVPAPTTSGTAAILVRDATTTSITATSNTFTVNAAALEALSIGPVGAQLQSVPFAVSGTIANATAAPTLQYQVSGGSWLAMPSGSSVTAASFRFTVPGIATAGTATIGVRDANAPSIATTSGSFQVGVPVTEGLTIATIGSQSAGRAFGVSGAITNATTIPSLQYQVSGGTWTAFPSGSNVTTTAWSFVVPGLSAGSATIGVRDPAVSTATASSNSFSVAAAGIEALTMQPIATQPVGVAFNVAGSISNTTTPPTLQYRDGSGAFVSLPAGAMVTSTSYSFRHPGLAASNSALVTVRDAVLTTVTAASTFRVAPQESPNLTVVTTAGPTVTDSTGVSYALSSAGTVSVNGVTDPTTANAIELGYVNRQVWYETKGLLWRQRAAGIWSPSAGTTLGPLPSSHVAITRTSTAPLAVVQGFPIAVPGIVVTDTVVSGTFTLSASSVAGTMTLPGAIGSGTPAVTTSGSLAYINAALHGLVYNAKTIGNGSVTILVVDYASASAYTQVPVTVVRAAGVIQR